jgi:hypothetical protein
MYVLSWTYHHVSASFTVLSLNGILALSQVPMGSARGLEKLPRPMGVFNRCGKCCEPARVSGKLRRPIAAAPLNGYSEEQIVQLGHSS